MWSEIKAYINIPKHLERRVDIANQQSISSFVSRANMLTKSNMITNQFYVVIMATT